MGLKSVVIFGGFLILLFMVWKLWGLILWNLEQRIFTNGIKNFFGKNNSKKGDGDLCG